MGKLTELLQRAQARAKTLDLPYAGAFTPQEAYQVLQLAPGAELVDVRTRAEQDWVGTVAGAVTVEWNHYPGGKRNEHFIAQLKQQVDRESLILFLCRSGGRSDSAARAAVQAGFGNCYNILEGFEGALDTNRQRNRIDGWRYAGLPWEQS